MAYIGKSPDGTGVRSRFYFTAAGGETSLSGTDDNAATLSFADGAYVDVHLNGVLLVAGTDYNTSAANTIAGLTALAANDIVEITVYDIFTVADTVSASAGGTFSANVAITGDLTVDTDTLHVDATNNRVGINDSTPSYTLDVNGDINFTGTLRENGVAFSAGKILQVQFADKSGGDFSTTSSSFTDAGLSLSITPTSSDSKIFVLFHGEGGQTDSGRSCFYRVLRGATEIGLQDNLQTGTTFSQMPMIVTQLDSPATTSATTYKVQMRTDGVGTVKLIGSNRSHITLLEVAN